MTVIHANKIFYFIIIIAFQYVLYIINQILIKLNALDVLTNALMIDVQLNYEINAYLFAQTLLFHNFDPKILHIAKIALLNVEIA